MNKVLRSLLLSVAMLTAFPMSLTAAPAAAPERIASPSFIQVFDNLDVRRNTKLHVQEFWKSVQGQEVTWSGDVFDVKAGSSKVKLYVVDRSRPNYKGFNIIVSTQDVAKAATLNKGSRVRFKGSLDSYSLKRDGAVIEVASAELL